MTETSRAWTGSVALGAAGDAGPYSANQWAELWRLGSGNGAADNDSGPIMGSGTAPDPGLTVSATGPATATVNVSVGAALVNGTFYNNDATKNLAIASNVSGNPRIDTVVLRKDWTAQTVRLAVLTGTPAVTPVATNLTQTAGVLWEIPLADIAVVSGFVTLAQSTITPRRHWANVADGIYLNDMLNNSGAILVAGDVVIRDTTADRAATSTTTAADPLILGVWVARTAAGAYGRVLHKGIGYVNLSAAATRGNRIAVSATAKKADVIAASPTPSRNLYTIGVALETTSGAGLCLCLIDIPIVHQGVSSIIKRDNGATYTTTSLTFVDIDATNLSITLVITGSAVLLTLACALNIGAAFVNLDVLIDGTRYASAGTDGIISCNVPLSGFSIIVGGLSAGSHTFKLQWKVSGNTASLYSGNGVATTDVITCFSAVEVG